MTIENNGISTHQRIHYAITFIIMYVVWAATYTFISEIVSTKDQYTLCTSLDTAIPFVPEFEFIYILCYIIPFVPLVIIHEKKQMNLLITTFIIMNIIAFLIFIFFPVYCPRPKFHVNSIATNLLALEYSVDKPVNNFPSLHVAIAWLVFFSTRNRRHVIHILLFFVVIGISISTLFIKQHYIADVVAGFLLAFGAYFLVKYFNLRRAMRL